MPDVPTPALLIEGLIKDVGPVPALDGRMKRVLSDVSLRAHHGQVTVILGTNGAGKTTCLECAQGLSRRQGGRVELLGEDPEFAGARLRARVGVMLQDGGLPPSMRPLALLGHVAGMYQNPRPIAELAGPLGLDEFADTAIRRLSGGQRQRVALAAALIGRPEVVFLDEPNAGLDPQSRQTVFEMILGLRQQGLAVVLTTHLLDEAQRLADYIYIIDDGRTVAQGTVPELLNGDATGTEEGQERTLTFEAAPGSNFQPGLRPGLSIEELRPGSYRLRGHLQPQDLADLVGCWASLGIMPVSMSLSAHSLEDVFLRIARERDQQKNGQETLNPRDERVP